METNKLYAVDWGEDSNGGQFALVKASNLTEAYNICDEVGGPFLLAELSIQNREIDYQELSSKPHTGKPLKWIPSCKIFNEIYADIERKCTNESHP